MKRLQPNRLLKRTHIKDWTPFLRNAINSAIAGCKHWGREGVRVREQEEDGKDRKGAVDMVYCVHPHAKGAI